MTLSTANLLGGLKKHPTLVICGSLSLLLAVGIYFRSTAIPDATAELEVKSSEGERLKANIANSAQLNEQYEAVKAANQEVLTRVFRPAELAKNLQYFYRLEAETGAKCTDLRQLPVVPAPAKGPKPTYIGVPFSVSLEGDYNQILTFIRRLETGAHYCRVLTASFQRSGPDLARSPIGVTLTLEVLGQP